MSKASTDLDHQAKANTAGRRLRWGIAGYGDVVHKRVAPAIVCSADAVLAGIWGRDLVRAQRTASNFATVGTDNLRSLCRDIDALYVATPVSSHLTIAAVGAEAGCHVLIEKPVSVGLEEASQLESFARLNSIRIGVAYYRRLMPAAKWLKERIDAEAFGKPIRASVCFSMPFAPLPTDPMLWRHDRTVAGGGVLADAGSHRMDLLSMLFGRPAWLSATFDDFTQHACERSAKVRLQWTERFCADIDVRWGEGRFDRLELEFVNARLVLDPLDSGAIQIWEGGSLIGVTELSAPANPHLALIRDFETAILGGVAPACDLMDGLFIDKMLLAAATSDAIRRPVELGSQDERAPHIRVDTHSRAGHPASR
jgi:predicted dehydrogenase